MRQPLPQVRPGRSRARRAARRSGPAGCSHRAAFAAGSEVATSRPVKIVTIFSTVNDWPGDSSTAMSWPISPGLSTRLSPRRCRRAVAPHDGSCGDGDRNLRLGGLRGQQHRVVGQLLGFHRAEMVIRKVAIPLDQRVPYIAVHGRADLDGSGPVLRDDRRLQRPDVRHVHRDEPALCHRGRPAGVVAEPKLAASAPHDAGRGSDGRRGWSTASTSNQGPPSMRNVSGSQFGRFTRLSLSIVVSEMLSVSRLYTPAA